ncbi:MAG TPA: proton-conducting transporter membrane subunit [Planctomycetota bacterium]|nr:proton-conducting transporter membrane subunit [Planctomycetota bacterium]
MIELLVAAFAAPLVGVAVTFTPKGREHALWVLLAAALATTGATIGALAAGPLDAPVAFLDRYFVADALSRLLAVTISVVFLGVALYTRHRVLTAPELRPYLVAFTRLSLPFLSASLAALLGQHLVLTWVFVEATTLTAAPLICHRADGDTAVAWRYLMFSTVGLGLVFLGFVCLGIAIEGAPGETRFLVDELGAAAARPSVWRRIGLALVILGYGTKLGLAPMYAWLPETYDAAPPSVTTLLAAIQTSVVFLALMRVLQVYRPLEPELTSYELVGLGMASMVLSTVHLVAATNYKRLLAYAAMNHNAVVAVGLGIGKAAIFGVVLYLTTNALVKAILFLACGNIKARYKTKSVAELRGLVDHMPYSGALFMLGTFALLGFAPFGSFLGEVLIMGGLMEANHAVMFIAFAVLFTVVFIATGRSLFPMIWGELPSKVDWRGESAGSILPTLVPLSLLLLIGVSIPSSIDTIFEHAALAMGGAR